MKLFASLRNNRVAAVLGCGPAGLFATHALVQNGWNVIVYSRKRRSEMFGAQYLHGPIEGLTVGAGRTLRYHLTGEIDAYRRKVYGDQSNVAVSPQSLSKVHQAWDIRQAYYNAWDLYQERVLHVNTINTGWLERTLSEYKLVVSTLPAHVLCEDAKGDHVFSSRLVWAIGDAPERGIFCPVSVNPMTVELNGERDVGWYRAANVYGYRTAEWPEGRKPPIEGVASIAKPISTNCNCFPGIIRLGRYGKWTKGVLAHDAYNEAAKL